jgi:general secretion pathway protein G
MARTASSGFTLVELLVVLGILAALVAAILPFVIGQSGEGELQRLVQDVRAVEGAAKTFRLDVGRWPGKLTHLVVKPTSSETDAFGTTYPSGLLRKWSGPYLERGSLPGDTLLTALGGVFLPQSDTLTWGATPFVRVRVKGIAIDRSREVSELIDGDTSTTDGRVRAKADTLIYLISPGR